MKEINYDNIAWSYDWLSRIVFGSAIRNAQIQILPFIGDRKNVLIAGGGTGWILEEITKLYPSGLRITYIDISAKMIRRSKKRAAGLNEVNFINQSINTVTLKEDYYDVIITPFFLDNFSHVECNNIFKKLHKCLKQNGKWLYSDFELKQKNKLWHKAIVKLMYLFFKITCNIQANQLPDVDIYFLQHNYNLIWVRYNFNKLIVSKVFEKPA